MTADAGVDRSVVLSPKVRHEPSISTIEPPSSMNVRVISCLTSGRISGVDIFAVHLTAELIRRGVDARILLTNPDKVELDRLPLPQHVPMETLPKEWRSKRRYRRQALRQFLLERAPCIYIPNYDYDHSPISAWLPESIYTVGIIHSDDPMHYDHVRQLGRFWNGVVAVSRQIADNAAAIPWTEEKLHTIPYGIPRDLEKRERPSASTGPLEILYVGRIEQTQKRILDMPAILDQLEAMGTPVRLSIVGDGPARGALEERAQKHIERGTLKLLGTQPNDRMPDLYRAADIFLLTSAFEGLPVSLLEAMSFGCVPVVTRVESGVREVIIEGQTGSLLDIGDVEGFAKRIADLHQDRAQLAAISQGARNFIDAGEHSLERMADRYVELFTGILNQHQQGAYQRPTPYFGELFVRGWQCRIRRNVRRIQARLGK